jgi:hypothetical protein
MPSRVFRVCFFSALVALSSLLPLHAQIDPAKRQLLQVGYNAFFQGHAPIAGYAFYYLNRPEFWKEDLTLRMAIAPVYFDSELGISHAIGPNTDLGIGVAGGGFADSYHEVRQGKYFPKESFDGHGGGVSMSLYHLFNPGQRIPLYGLMRGGAYYSTYTDTDDTADRFELPDDRASANFRTGLRWGGKEPVLFPSLAMELSIWFESLNRGNSGDYGYVHDRDVRSSAQLFYAHGFLAYTFERGDNASIALTTGTSANTDRFSAYRLGGVLPLVAEYPLIIPGYYYQEISATRFFLVNAQYAFALDEKKRWQLTAMAASAAVSYLHGTEQRGSWHSGVGGGVYYKSVSEIWKIALTYGYGFDAIRESGRGSHVVGFTLQLDLDNWWNKRRSAPFWWEPR